jgi:hypothetical protein
MVVKFAVAVTDDGGVGTPPPATVNEISFEGTLAPTAFFAVTRKLLATPGVRPSIRAERYRLDRVETTTHVTPASVERQTSYEVTAEPPVAAGEPQETYADVPEMKPVRDLGADGAENSNGVAVTTLDETLFPTAFTANTRN